jgi:hypothetical protein
LHRRAAARGVRAWLTVTRSRFGTSHFRVLIGRRELGFCEVGRLSSETELTQPPGERRNRFETIVLRRALTQSTELYDWRKRIVDGARERRQVTIQQLDGSAARSSTRGASCGVAVPVVRPRLQRARGRHRLPGAGARLRHDGRHHDGSDMEASASAHHQARERAVQRARQRPAEELTLAYERLEMDYLL